MSPDPPTDCAPPAPDPASGGAGETDAGETDAGETPAPGAPLEAAVRDAGCGVFWLDEDLRVRRANAAFARFCGRPAAELVGVPITDLDPDWPHGPPAEALATLRARTSVGHAAALPGPGGRGGSDGNGSGAGLPVQMHLNFLSLGGLESVFGVAVDVSDRQAAEDALRHSEARYRAVTDSQTEFILRFRPAADDPDQTVTFCNAACARLLDAGVPAAVVGRPMPDYVHPDDRDAVNARVAAIAPDNPITAGENRVLTPGGRELWTAWVNRGVFAEPRPGEPPSAGRLLEVQAVGRDVTDRVLADAALARAKERYASLVEDSPELVNRWRPDGTLTYANRTYAQFFDLPPGPAADRNVLADLSPHDRAKVDRALAAMTPDTPLARVVTRERRRDGALREIEWIKRGFFKKAPDGTDTGELAEVQCVGRDATDRREARRALRRSEALLRGVLDDMDEMVVRYRPDGVYTYANRAFCEARGTSPGALVGRAGVFDRLREDAADVIRARHAAATPEDPRGSVVIPIDLPDGATRWEEWTVRALFADPDPADPHAAPRVAEFQSVGRDMTGEIARESRRRAAADAAGKLAALSPREREVLTAVADGVTNKVIARRLGITERTVEKHRSAAMRKLGVRSAAELVRVAVAAEAASSAEIPAAPPA